MEGGAPLLDAAKNMGVALLVGFLIGLDRERSEARDQVPRMGGVRTFPIIALLGAMSSLLWPIMGIAPLVLSSLGVTAVLTVAYIRTSSRAVGATTEMAALLTYVLGVVAGQGGLLIAAAGGVVTAVLLAAKPRLEAFSRALSSEEMHATLELAVISAIVLPLLPNEGYGPYEALNPFKLWMVAVLISAVSFAGFVAMRLWGERKGLIVTAFVGALVSSTAVTMAMAAKSRDNPSASRAPAAGAVMASTIMCVRVFILVSAFGRALLRSLWLPLGVMTAIGLVASVLLFWRAQRRTEEPAKMANPSSLPTALTFAAIFAVVRLLVPFAKDVFGGSGVLVAAALSAVADVDAIAIALAQQAKQDFSSTLVLGIVIASVVNTWIKGGIAVAAGRGAFRWQVALPLSAMGVAGMATALVAHWMS